MLPVHNHPFGDPTASPEDIQATEHTMAAGDLLSIDVLNHVILAIAGPFTSLAARRTVHPTSAGEAA